MKEMIKKSALLGLVGVPVFIVSVAISNGVIRILTKPLMR